ncbi:hypothetical protein Oweho_2886 [Owenweeksia hongkongensis DSM 17368]|uniref:DUF1456 domain-containing protein n=1 Tax=Owenweeksia hongkongensis (strain DSM 17368 / CIP 108786 / JCM 12287 / NRRL B-23963 / UST20020801) TaxID=926562 RepID=G8R1A1_OWEHD|nr:DUF1456 family protein [Owenweeksia hongkongensis]AEV33844.1 hypothetical protein Oweho_2886 [Owenweeksia hongkongensis DSM 17368]
MTNNDILKRIRYTFDYSDAEMIDLFAMGGAEVTRAQVSDWLKKELDDDYRDLDDRSLATFLNGLIVERRGPRADGMQMTPEDRLNNNIILKKIKIALDLKTDDILALFKSIDKKMGPHELSAFLRNHKQSQYRPFQDQYLRYFLTALQQKYRGKNDRSQD